MIPYLPQKISKPETLIEVPSAWKGLENILGDIMERFNVRGNKALEFGVEYGFSTVALSNFFDLVIGVDTFEGDANTSEKNVEGLYEAVKAVMPKNVRLIKSRYQDYVDTSDYDLIHVDIVHTYNDTFDCGSWAMQHSNLVIFHDTQTFIHVFDAVHDLSRMYDAEFYHYPFFNGLGILWKR